MSATTSFIAGVLLILVLIVASFGGYAIGSGILTGEKKISEKSFENLKNENENLQDQIQALQSVNAQLLRDQREQDKVISTPPLLVENFECDRLLDDKRDIEDELDDLDDEIEDLEDDIAAKKAAGMDASALEDKLEDKEDERDDLEDELDDVKDDLRFEC
jgi:chromosome segregation ATPase